MLRTQFLSQLNRLVSDYQNKKYVLALSGGVDSIVLFDLLSGVLSQDQLTIGHFNHRTRAGESDLDEEFVCSISAKAGVKCIVGRRVGEGTSEASLRTERLKFLKEVCEETASDYILFAHHQQDQLETFLMRLIRGAGTRGLSGMRAKNGRLVRPLLGCPKAEIERYAVQNKLKFRTDSSNLDSRYFRNRIRHELLPVFLKLTKTYGGAPKFYNRFSQMTDALASIAEEEDRQGRILFGQLAVKTDYFIRINQIDFLKLRVDQQAHLIREVFTQLTLEAPSRIWLERILKFLNTDKKNLSLPNARCLISCGEVYFQNRDMVALPQPKIHLKSGVWHCPQLGIQIQLPSELAHLKLRFFNPGDRIRSTKLKKWFLEQRIPAPERGLTPILAESKSSEIFWVYPQPHPSVQWGDVGFPFSTNEANREY